MKVRFANDGAHRFFVEAGGSDKEMVGEEYTVDLERHGGLGECGCKRWTCKVWPLIRDGQRPDNLFAKEFSCGHIREARRYHYEILLRIALKFVPKEIT